MSDSSYQEDIEFLLSIIEAHRAELNQWEEQKRKECGRLSVGL